MNNGIRSTQKMLLQQAWPILIGQWAGISFAILDTMMLGNFNPDALQAMSLSVSIFLTVNVSLMGVIHALIPIFAQLQGSQKFKHIGMLWGQGIWLALGLSLVVGLLLLFPDVWLSLSGDVSPHVRQEVSSYLKIAYLAIPASLMFRAIYSLCTSVSRPKHVMYINVASIVVKALLNWLFIFGHLGLPALGSVGASLSTMIVSWFTFFLGLWIIFTDPYYQKFHLVLGLPKLKHCKLILKLGIPMGGSYLVEISAFTFMALLAAREGIIASGGHQILVNLAAFLYMMPQSLGIATAALSAQAIGSKNYILSHSISKQGLWLGFLGAMISVLTVYFGKSFIIFLYTDNEAVALMATSLLMIMPIFHLLDYFQCVITYVLRAHKIAMIPFIIQTLLLIGLGLGGGYYFGYGAGQPQIRWLNELLTPGAATGVSSLWIMCCAALLLCSTLLTLWYAIIIRKKLSINRK